MNVLSPAQRKSFFYEGYIILPSFFSKETTGLVKKMHSDIWDDRPSSLVVDDLNTGIRSKISDIPIERLNNRFKYSDLYLLNEQLRNSIACNAELFTILKELMIDIPVLCNTLNLDYGSSQPIHVDALYMKPTSPYNLLAVWVALEDVSLESGPLFYVPESHLFEQYVFSNGDTKALEEEMPLWSSYIEKQIQQWGLKRRNFLAKEGDVFIWHAYLCHGGSRIFDHSLTRKSMVCHYFTKSDAEKYYPVVDLNDGGWLQKPSLNV